jgi:serine/threonine protein phosphatase PrpC
MIESTLISLVSSRSEIGNRSSQEDRYASKQLKGLHDTGWLLAVADGHGGAGAAEICQSLIMDYILDPNEETVENHLRVFFQELNKATIHITRGGAVISIACILEKADLVAVAILGDAPVFVLDKVGAFHRSPDHNIRTNRDELDRALARGAVYADRGYIYPPDHSFGLQFGRALGNSNFGRILSREPEVYIVKNPLWVAVLSDGALDPSHEKQMPDSFGMLAKTGADANDVINWTIQQGALEDNATAVIWRRI